MADFEIPLPADTISESLQKVAGADSQPLAGSDQMVRSGGVYQQIQDSTAPLAADITDLQADMVTALTPFPFAILTEASGNQYTSVDGGNYLTAVADFAAATGSLTVSADDFSVTVGDAGEYYIEFSGKSFTGLGSSGTSTWHIHRNGASIGSFSISAGTTDVFRLDTFVTLAAGDLIRIFVYQAGGPFGGGANCSFEDLLLKIERKA